MVIEAPLGRLAFDPADAGKLLTLSANKPAEPKLLTGLYAGRLTAKLGSRRGGSFRGKTEATADVVGLDLADDDIEMPFLMFWLAPNVSSVDDNGPRTRIEGCVLRGIQIGDVFRNPA
ncbi:MAG: hypothetical protein AAF636_26065 [Pseudomonadota bacterium]